MKKSIDDYDRDTTIYKFEFNDKSRNFRVVNHHIMGTDMIRMIWFKGSEYDSIVLLLRIRDAEFLDTVLRRANDESIIRQTMYRLFMSHFKKNVKLIIPQNHPKNLDILAEAADLYEFF